MKVIAKLLCTIIIINSLAFNYAFSDEKDTINEINTMELTEPSEIIEDNIEKNLLELDEPIVEIKENESKAWEKKKNITNIDTPRETISNRDILVSGWALNDSGMRKVNIYIDNQSKGQAKIGLPREDVNAAFPGYIDGDKSGYELNIDVNEIKPGFHIIRVEAIGNDGTIQNEEIGIEITKPQNITNIDTPREDINNEDILVRGWALNASGVKEVNIYIDEQNKGKATIGLPREDVNIVYPGYVNGEKSGYEAKIDVNTISPGFYMIRVEAIGNDGTIQNEEIGIEIKKSQNITNIDTPREAINNADISVKGWALNASGVREINIYVDNQNKGKATLGIPREDVNVAYPGYVDGDKSGYEAKVDINGIGPGFHIIRVEAIGNDGTVKNAEIGIEITKPQNITNIDTPREAVNNQDIAVKGWALNASGVREINIYVDNQNKGKATLGIPREDVNATYPGYVNGDKSGYEVKLDINGIGPGFHVIRVEAIGNDGTVKNAEIGIEITKPQNITNIDTPRVAVNNEDIAVKGWALNASGVREINIYVDNQNKGKATLGLPREDVNAVYPGYVDGDKSGYEAKVDINGVGPGFHVIRVEAIGNDGTVKNAEIGIEITKPQPKAYIDEPGDNIKYEQNKSISVKGWAVNASGIEGITVFLDHRTIGSANIGIDRPDVYKVYPEYPESNKSGFEIIIPSLYVMPGEHKLSVTIRGKDGSSQTITKQIIIANDLIVIDPGHGGSDSGATGNGFKEKDLNLDISRAASEYLRNEGYDVVITRTTDQYLALQERSKMSNDIKSKMFISIHNDSGGGNGAHVIYSVKDKNGGPSKDLARNILNSITTNTSQNSNSRGIWTRTLSDGSSDYYHVIREVEAISVIVECAFMDTSDIDAVNTKEKRTKMGQAIAKGVINTIK